MAYSPQGPDTESAAFWCEGRSAVTANEICPNLFWLPHDQVFGRPDRCQTCATIDGVIVELRTLVFREPWWATEGKGGEPQKEAWELEGVEEKKYCESGGESKGDGMDTGQRSDFIKRMMDHFISTQGHGLTEEEVLTGGYSGPGLESRGSTLVGEMWEGKIFDGEEKEFVDLAARMETIAEKSV